MSAPNPSAWTSNILDWLLKRLGLEENDMLSASDLWQERVLAAILALSLSLGLAASIRGIKLSAELGLWWPALVISLANLLAAVCLLRREIPFEIRAWASITVGYTMGLMVLVAYGPAASGHTLFLGISIIASILLGLRAALATIIASTTTLLVVGMLYLQGRRTWLFVSPDYPAEAWHTTNLTYLVLAVALSGSLALLIRFLRRLVARLEAANVELQTEVARRELVTQELSESEGRTRAILQAFTDMLVVFDGKGTYLEVVTAPAWNPVMPTEEMIGKTVLEVLPPEAAESSLASIRETLRSGGLTRIEFSVPQAETIRTYESRKVPCGGNEVLAIVRDITDQKQGEETQLQLVRQERLASVGQLAAGIAHDFNNLLTSIIGFAGLMQEEPGLSGQSRGDLASIISEGQRGARLVRQILDFGRQSVRSPQRLDLNQFMSELLTFWQRTIPERIELSLKVECEKCDVLADPDQLKQALTNLVLNACDSMPSEGTLSIRLWKSGSLPEGLSPLQGKTSSWIALSIADTGHGMTPEVLAHLYEPFFTTKETGEGTGLGLAQVYGIVQQHEGQIDVQSQAGEGSTFTVYLPAAPDAVPPSGWASETAPHLEGGGETILLAEDQEGVLRAATAMLERMGYRVLQARNGQEGLDLYEERADEIALVVSDLVMPVMGGPELLRELRARYGEVRMLITSGYPLGDQRMLADTDGIAGWIPKPFSYRQLAQAVAQALGRGTSVDEE